MIYLIYQLSELWLAVRLSIIFKPVPSLRKQLPAIFCPSGLAQAPEKGFCHCTLDAPFIPLPSSWKVFRLEPCSSVCSLPEEATLLCGERGAWSGVVKAARAPSSSGLGHSPGACGLVGMSDMERFSGLGWIWQGRPGQRRKSKRSGGDLSIEKKNNMA